MFLKTSAEREAFEQLTKREIGDLNLLLFHRIEKENEENKGAYEDLLSDFQPFMDRFFTASFDECFKMAEIMPDNSWANFQQQVRSYIKSDLSELSLSEIISFRRDIAAFMARTDIT